MKRILAVILAVLTLLPLLVSCAPALVSEDPTSTGAGGVAEETKTGVAARPDTIAVGYASIDISGKMPVQYYGGLATSVHDPLLLTCIALWDGKELALVMTADLKKMLDHVALETQEILQKKFGVPAENVILSCTHSHSAPDAGVTTRGNTQWVIQYYQKLPRVVEAAIADLAPVTGAYAGVSQMEAGVTFVRRYYLESGKVRFNPSPAMKPVRHESEADPEMRTVRFERKGKKDVLLVNFQTHYGGAPTKYPGNLSADFVDPFRNESEKNYDCHFAYFSGAGGNINFVSALKGERKYTDYLKAIPAFTAACDRALEAEESVRLGPVSAQKSEYVAHCQIRDPQRVVQAQEIKKYGITSPEGASLMERYGFESNHEVNFTVANANLPETETVPLNAITFGDIGFVGAPYEMFDTNGKQIRDGSVTPVTFVCTLSGGARGYVPSALGYQNGSYETFNCRYAAGSGEAFAAELIRLLEECKKAE